jgi:hypothetical protein
VTRRRCPWWRRGLVAASLLCLIAPAAGGQDPPRTANVVLVTLDGLRWQEVFSGADPSLIRETRFVRDTTALLTEFWADDAARRREMLLPFIWSTISRHGQLHGNRLLGSTVDVTNPHRFSYPGYSELLVGYHDPAIDSNAKRPNPNVTVLEFIAGHPGFGGRVAAFGSWDVFPYIVNEQRSGIPVNAGFAPARGPDLSAREVFLNTLQEQIPSPWASVRLDAFTHHYALEHLRKYRPRLLYVAYGETDDFAHDGRYDAYLRSARQSDRFIRELWEWVQADPEYAGRTTLVVTTDHGRGSGDEWTRHGQAVAGAEQIWIAVLGPDSPALGESNAPSGLQQSQVAATVARLLGLEYVSVQPVAPPLEPVFGSVGSPGRP